MPTIKPLDYTPKQISISLLGRAIAHPCRVKMIELLIKYPKLTNKDLAEILHLSKSAIHTHLIKLWDAGLINVSYSPHSLCVEITQEQILNYRKLEAIFNFEQRKTYHLSLLQ
ncbi:winged helix-turn-helix domain-containing protein [Fluviicola taffensis]|uniref:Regulatory protein ArsR n=1 Tax=Fluviicola taffensis (strain DSM 16823 / NCIMB 13979 / RW262) TaxID=755732 RepID=F2IH40_FLUTR|nr:winged helix-turn-helix domain-containing protein [Fluviicola taffensis]AEA45854.1 regulatory protein ArsR [Fluviicola taffensis DSM 16823]